MTAGRPKVRPDDMIREKSIETERAYSRTSQAKRQRQIDTLNKITVAIGVLKLVPNMSTIDALGVLENIIKTELGI